jgi:hypothetical protein
MTWLERRIDVLSFSRGNIKRLLHSHPRLPGSLFGTPLII